MKKFSWLLIVVLAVALAACQSTPAPTEAPTQAQPAAATEAPAAAPEAPFAVMPGGFLEKALAGEYTGTTVTVDGAFEGNYPDGVKMDRSVAQF